jgi:hypothetical protein
LPWCIRAAIAGILLYVLLAAAGFLELALWALILVLLAVIAPFVGLGMGAFLFGFDLFQQRRRAGQTMSAVVGLMLLSLAGAFCVWMAVGAVWGFLRGWLRRL